MATRLTVSPLPVDYNFSYHRRVLRNDYGSFNREPTFLTFLQIQDSAMDIKKHRRILLFVVIESSSTLLARFLTNDCYRETQVITGILHVEFQGWIETDDPRLRPFKRDGGRGGGYLAASSGHFIRARRGGPRWRATMMTLIRKHAPQLHPAAIRGGWRPPR